MILTYDAYNETLEIQKQKDESFNAMEKQVGLMQSQLQNLILALGNMDGNDKNVFAKELFHSVRFQHTVMSVERDNDTD